MHCTFDHEVYTWLTLTGTYCYSHARKYHKNLLIKNIPGHKPVQFIWKCLLRLMWELVVTNQFCMVYCILVLYFMKIYQDIACPQHDIILLKKTNNLNLSQWNSNCFFLSVLFSFQTTVWLLFQVWAITLQSTFTVWVSRLSWVSRIPPGSALTCLRSRSLSLNFYPKIMQLREDYWSNQTGEFCVITVDS